MTVNPSEASQPQSWFVLYRGRVRGPFPIPKLRTMRDRGEFSRIHQVSADRKNWQSASSLEEVFGANSSPASPQAASLKEPDQAAPPLPAEGEIAAAAIRSTHSTTLRSASTVPKRNSRGIQPGAVFVGLLLLGAVVPMVFSLLPSRDTSTPAAPDFYPPARTTAVENLTPVNSWTGAAENVVDDLHGADSEQQLNQALGLVVCGLRIRRKPGEVLELPMSTGSCFLVTADGHAITNRHVVELLQTFKGSALFQRLQSDPEIEPEMAVWILFPDGEYNAELTFLSDRFDLALLKIDRSEGPFLRLSASPDLSRGIEVYAFGFPGAGRVPLSDEERATAEIRQEAAREIRDHFTWRDRQFSETRGTVSRVIEEDASLRRRWVQHTAATSPGNSGGPLITADGVVRGISTQIARDAAGVNYALAMSQLRRELDQHIPSLNWQP